jgi:hypothetical protein
LENAEGKLLPFKEANDFSSDHEELLALLKEIEETNECSAGFCSDQPSAFYLFSNLNDGIPKNSCHEPVADMIRGTVNVFLFAFIIPLAECCLVSSAYGFIILFKICKKMCYRKTKHSKNAKRGKNEDLSGDMQ